MSGDEGARRRNTVGRRGYGDDFYAEVAKRYLELAGTHGRRIAPVIAQERGITPFTVHRWVTIARRKGFLPPVKDIIFGHTACTCGRFAGNPRGNS